MAARLLRHDVPSGAAVPDTGHDHGGHGHGGGHHAGSGHGGDHGHDEGPVHTENEFDKVEGGEGFDVCLFGAGDELEYCEY